MSIAASTRTAYAVEVEEKSPEFRPAATTPEVESALERITVWIPTEVVAVYIGLLGIFTPDEARGKWIIFGIAAVLLPVFVIINGLLVTKRGAAAWRAENRPGEPPKFSWGKGALIVVLAGIAYVAWTFALPATPWLEVTDNAQQIGGAAVIVLSLLIPPVAELLDLRLPRA